MYQIIRRNARQEYLFYLSASQSMVSELVPGCDGKSTEVNNKHLEASYQLSSVILFLISHCRVISWTIEFHNENQGL